MRKRMVYPEKINFDQGSDRPIARPAWCNDSPDKSCNNSPERPKFTGKEKSNNGCDRKLDSSSSENSEENHQFIQDRIRHLVDAFSTRAQAARQRLEGPQTPSSLSSSAGAEGTHSAISSAPRLSVSLSDKYVEEEPEIRVEPRSYREKFLNHVKIIDPNGKIFVSWMALVTLAVLYNAWVIPLRSTFPFQTKENRRYWMLFDYTADLIYLMDVILVQPRVKYLNEGFWVTEKKALRQNYINNKHFKLDLVSLLPLDIFYIVTGPDVVLLRFPRLLKFYAFWEFFGLIDRQISNPYIIRITQTLVYMMYLIHLNACGYYAFSLYEGIGSNNFVYNGQGNAYIKCFYFATKTATSIGKNPKPTQEVEYIFMTFSWLMGVFVFALLIGQIRDIISTATRSKTEYRKLVDETLEYMRRLNLPQEMQRRVQLWFNYTWETQHTLDENNIMDCLPHKMKTDIAINVHINTLNKVKLFADCDEALLRELVLELKSVIYLPEDIICKKGDVGTEMYIVQSGKVQVIGGKEGKEVLATLSEGSVFGEISLLGIPGMNRRTADVRSYGYSNLFVLDKASLNAALSHYPEAQELLNKKAKLLMKKNEALEQKNKAMIIIKNPTSPERHAKLLETVLQVLPPDSKTNRLLRYGSRQARKPRPENDKFKYRNSLPAIRNHEALDRLRQESAHRETSSNKSDNSQDSDQEKVTIHRSLNVDDKKTKLYELHAKPSYKEMKYDIVFEDDI
ncbi:cyclic nucleotide-gated cation channel beta-1 isoform X2 [Sitophilus oryzae]|uniref:Cyclic nucleotide-gated cation channel beta-1 isoform X2 n=1 Tax=Sitophilus oryzae TaxID=7048 RepID=A0A6J2YTQ8_SITOR|nr:cyclic nucleotide-gated cation channel beta-1 isoform X2 [Sitophilus oryzae]